MAETFNDISHWQGVIDWSKSPYSIAVIKMSGGDAGLYTDSKANANYYGAKNAGKAIGGYHFAGGGNAQNEADFFIAAMSPLEKDDVLILDWEIQHPDPVGWCAAFVQRVIDRTGTRPLIYMNTSTENAYNWKPVIDKNIGLWVADYRYGPEANVPIKHWPTYVAHQYTSSGSTAGIAGRVDTNQFFGTTAQFRKYGYQPAPAPTPPPIPAPAPVPPPIVISPPAPLPPKPPVDPTPPPTPVTPPIVIPVVPPVVKPEPTPYPNWFIKFWTSLIASIKNILKKGE